MGSESSRTIVFRADASVAIGNGHVMRCLALADRLRLGGYRCHFICCDYDGHLGSLVAEHGHAVSLLPADEPDQAAEVPWATRIASRWPVDAGQSVAILRQLLPRWLVVDHYALDARWEREVAPHCERLMVIDDLADRPHECDLLLDQSLGREERCYAELVPARCEVLVGPRFALLRPQFAEARVRSIARRERPALRHVLISMGGTDQDNVTGRVLEELAKAGLQEDLQITVVLGRHSPCLPEVREQARRQGMQTRVIVDAQDMASLLSDADLAIGGCGTTAWERCCLGVPALVLVLAENQAGVARALALLGAVECIGGSETLDQRFGPALRRLRDPATLSDMGIAASRIVDGLGTDRVSERLEALGG